MFGINRKARVFWPVCLLIVLVDCSSKSIVVEKLGAPDFPEAVADNVVRFTLSYNPDAAMGLSLGPFSRIGFALAALFALQFMRSLYRRAKEHDTWQLIALALVSGGATGNLIDRIRSARGVVDFIDVGLGPHRFWWVFNLADVGVTVGAALLALAIWRADQQAAPSSGAADFGQSR
jgi:signal peptidase II